MLIDSYWNINVFRLIFDLLKYENMELVWDDIRS